jgi:hypothetical protein
MIPLVGFNVLQMRARSLSCKVAGCAGESNCDVVKVLSLLCAFRRHTIWWSQKYRREETVSSAYGDTSRPFTMPCSRFSV